MLKLVEVQCIYFTHVPFLINFIFMELCYFHELLLFSWNFVIFKELCYFSWNFVIFMVIYVIVEPLVYSELDEMQGCMKALDSERTQLWDQLQSKDDNLQVKSSTSL